MPKAERARIEYAGALHLFPASADGWTPRVLTCSSTVTGEGIAEIWQMVLEHRAHAGTERHFWRNGAAGRRSQWMNELITLGLEELFRRDPRGGRAAAGTARGGAMRAR